MKAPNRHPFSAALAAIIAALLALSCGSGTSSGTGGSGTVTLTSEDFPSVGICSTGAIDVTGATFKALLAAVTSFTFIHKTYSTDADIPFICGEQGSWDPSDAAAFNVESSLNMTDSLSDLSSGTFGNIFICNDGFGFSGGSGEGLNDAGNYRGELKFTTGGTTYRARFKFAISGSGAGQTLQALGLSASDFSLTDANGAALTTVGGVRDLLAASPASITVNAVAQGSTRLTATGGFICAGTQ